MIMATYGGFNFTNFKGVRLRNTAAIRIVGDGGIESTLSVKPSQDTARAWQFPDKSGTFGVTGTVEVNLPAVSAHSTSDTNVVVSGVRAEDAVVATIQNGAATGITTRGMVVLAGAQAGNGGINLTFVEVTGTATVYEDLVVAYTIVR